MQETFVKPAVGAIIESIIDGEKYILVQERQKEGGGVDNGLMEIPSGKIREYENIFDALRREVNEETGLTVTKIVGEDEVVRSTVEGHEIISFEPYCITQNLSGVYSLMVSIFLCEAEGTLALSTNETQNIRWMKVEELKEILTKTPEKIFIMHINVLKKYLSEVIC